MSDLNQTLLKRRRSDRIMESSTPVPQPDSNTQTLRRQFNELHPKDQNTKLNRKARIEGNWQVEVQNCIPLKIRPRVEHKKGAKARVGDVNGAEEAWWNWSVEMLRALEELSTLTANKLHYAQEILSMEVSNRQSNPKHPQRRLVELLLGDVQRIVDNLRRTQAQGVQPGSSKGEGKMDGTDMKHVEEHQQANTEARDRSEDESSSSSSPQDNPVATIEALPHNPPTQTPNRSVHFRVPAASVNSFNSREVSPINTAKRQRMSDDMTFRMNIQLKSTEMRARAGRLRAQALNLEAQATELESDVAALRAQLDQD